MRGFVCVSNFCDPVTPRPRQTQAVPASLCSLPRGVGVKWGKGMSWARERGLGWAF